MWRAVVVVLACPLALLIAGCAVPRHGASSGAAPISNGAASAGTTTSESGTTPSDALTQERERSAQLQAQLAARDGEITQLQTEVQQLRDRETELRAALDRSLATSREAEAAAAAISASSDGAPNATDLGDAAKPSNGAGYLRSATVAALRAQLARERQRREQAENELARLKQETSTPPFADGNGAPDLPAARREITDLRAALADERTSRTKLAAQLDDLERRATQAAEHTPDPQDEDLRWRLQSLQAEKEAIVDSFTRSLAASQQRATELEQQVASRTDGTGADAGASGALQTENAALRVRLDQEHQRTEDLAKKLKVAARVTDLIFKMRAQQSSVEPLPAGTDQTPGRAAP